MASRFTCLMAGSIAGKAWQFTLSRRGARNKPIADAPHLFTSLAVLIPAIPAIALSGSTDFSVAGTPYPSQTFMPNDNFTLNLQYKPSTSLRVTGVLKISYSEQLPTPPNGVQPKATTVSFSFSISGVAPEFTFSYQPPPNGNATPLSPGDTILFPVTNVNDA